MNYDKILNCLCGECKICLSYEAKEVIMLEPCEHMIHFKCYDGLSKNNCPTCNKKIKTYYTSSYCLQHSDNPEMYQKYVDIISNTNCNHIGKINKIGLLENTPKVITFPFYCLRATLDKSYTSHVVDFIISLGNVKISIEGEHNIIKNQKKIFALKHTCALDSAFVHNILKSSFVGSITLKNKNMKRYIKEIFPVVYVDRTIKQNSVEKFKKHVEEHGSLCIYPEGKYSHPDTLIRFRSGGFMAGYPVYPVVIKYDKPLISDNDILQALKYVSLSEINVVIKILKPFYPPFNEDKIEMVRCAMAHEGGYALSRVSNKDINDVNT
jgi:1-acyl-sn-glycerol-3-phosphate acyltransferase